MARLPDVPMVRLVLALVCLAVPLFGQRLGLPIGGLAAPPTGGAAVFAGFGRGLHTHVSFGGVPRRPFARNAAILVPFGFYDEPTPATVIVEVPPAAIPASNPPAPRFEDHVPAAPLIIENINGRWVRRRVVEAVPSNLSDVGDQLVGPNDDSRPAEPRPGHRKARPADRRGHPFPKSHPPA